MKKLILLSLLTLFSLSCFSQAKIWDRATGTIQTTDGTTWTTVATYAVPSNTAVAVQSIHVLGKDALGNIAYASGTQAGYNNGGALAFSGSLVSLVTMATGSSLALSTSNYRIQADSGSVNLQVKGVAATTITWVGSMNLTLN